MRFRRTYHLPSFHRRFASFGVSGVGSCSNCSDTELDKPTSGWTLPAARLRVRQAAKVLPQHKPRTPSVGLDLKVRCWSILRRAGCDRSSVDEGSRRCLKYLTPPSSCICAKRTDVKRTTSWHPPCYHQNNRNHRNTCSRWNGKTTRRVDRIHIRCQ